MPKGNQLTSFMLFPHLYSAIYYSDIFHNICSSALIKKSHGIRVQATVAYFSVLTVVAFQIQNLHQLILYTGHTEGIIYICHLAVQ